MVAKETDSANVSFTWRPMQPLQSRCDDTRTMEIIDNLLESYSEGYSNGIRLNHTPRTDFPDQDFEHPRHCDP